MGVNYARQFISIKTALYHAHIHIDTVDFLATMHKTQLHRTIKMQGTVSYKLTPGPLFVAIMQ